jgi:hypothetical protein
VATSGGTVAAQVETSDDDFRSISAVRTVALPEGQSDIPLRDLPAARWARVTLLLTTPEGAERSPVVSAVELVAEPVGP